MLLVVVTSCSLSVPAGFLIPLLIILIVRSTPLMWSTVHIVSSHKVIALMYMYMSLGYVYMKSAEDRYMCTVIVSPQEPGHF